MRHIYIYIGIIACLCLAAMRSVAQQPITTPLDTLHTQRHALVFWNVENAFWPTDDPTRLDDDFTPQGMRRWSMSRLKHKLTDLTKGLLAMGGGQAPIAVGLAEVEGDSVMRYWTHSTALRTLHYRYLVADSTDRRGITTALLYQPTDFRLLHHATYTIPLPHGHHTTRPLLHAAGRLISSDTLDLIVCHLPSQLGGTRQSQDARDAAHQLLMHVADSIRQVRQSPHIVIMGDMNEAPSSRHPWWDPLGSGQWHNLMLPLQRDLTRHPTQHGTHKYQGEWSYLDQFIIHTPLADTTAEASLRIGNARNFSLPFMLTDDASYLGTRPKRSYYGANYEAGVSDHLPIMIDLEIRF